MKEENSIKKIGLLLSRYLDFAPPERVVAKALISTLEETLHITLQESEISVKGKSAYVSVSGIVKSEIALSKEKILQKTNKLVPGALVDIS